MRALALWLVLAVPVAAQPAADSLQAPWEAARRVEGEPPWAPLLRMRGLEAGYLASPEWRGAYAQMRAGLEAEAGQHATALAMWDASMPGRRRDSVGVLPPGTVARDAAAWIAAAADTARVVMVNERHHAASDRLLTLRLLPLLHARGFRYFAAEALDAADTSLTARGYAVGATGYYTREPVFAALVREALRLGFTVVPYEITAAQEAEADPALTRQQIRDRAQAETLARVLADDPGARMLVHAGFGHVHETVTPNWHPMAVYFRDLTGIDPLTVDQTALSERATPAAEHPAFRAARAAGLVGPTAVVLVGPDGHLLRPAADAVDIQVVSGATVDDAGRPAWRALDGQRTAVDVNVPECAQRWCWVAARAAGEVPDAVALDHAEADHVSSLRLFLPPGVPTEVVVYAVDGAPLRTLSLP